MKIKTTRKSINETFSRVCCVPYCSMQYLTMDIAPMAYTCGVYGWNADIYAFGSTAIVTGYRPFGKEIEKAVINSFENRAKELCQAGKYAALADLRNEFIQAL